MAANLRATARFLARRLTLVTRFLRAEEGPTAVEYAVILGFIIAVLITVISTIGNNTNKSFSNVSLQIAAGGGS